MMPGAQDSCDAVGAGGDSARGVTLIELMIVAVVLTGILWSLYGVFDGGADTYAIGVIGSDLERQAAETLELIASELADAGEISLFPRMSAPLSAAGVVYQRSLGWTPGGGTIWGPVTMIAMDYDVGETDNGVDDNGNGLVDECLIIRRENPGEANERRVVLTRWVREYLEGETPSGKDDNGNGLVDERGLAISADGAVWTIRLTLERRDSRGRLVTRTMETSVRPRN